jgi:2-polyprenyl-3-methyl-5-hydroxy-6-metoxy-1,4-benzoquinol methylase
MNGNLENDRILKCISCDFSNFNYYADNFTLKLPMYICQNCKLYVTGKSQKEIDKILQHYYDKDFWNEDLENLLESNFTDSYSIGRIKIWKSQKKYCNDILNNSKTILEIGSGHGEAIYNFDKIGYNVTGIEPDKKNVTSINKKLKNSKCIVEKAETFSFEKKFDIIWLNHVFEHLTQPIQFLRKISNFLNDSGFIFIEVPSVEKKNDYRQFKTVPHAYNYSKSSLINISKKANYKIIKCDYFRSPKLVEGGINKIFNLFLKKDFFEFYPKILCNKENGENIRLILHKNNVL